MKFESGQYYRRRDGQNALCVYVWPNGTAAFVLADRPMWSWSVGVSGTADSQWVCDSDIIGEWKEPRKWTVYLCERHGKVFASVDVYEPLPSEFTIIARTELTEGDGL